MIGGSKANFSWILNSWPPTKISCRDFLMISITTTTALKSPSPNIPSIKSIFLNSIRYYIIYVDPHAPVHHPQPRHPAAPHLEKNRLLKFIRRFHGWRTPHGSITTLRWSLHLQPRLQPQPRTIGTHIQDGAYEPLHQSQFARNPLEFQIQKFIVGQ